MSTNIITAEIIRVQNELIAKQEEHIQTLNRIIDLHQQMHTKTSEIIASYEHSMAVNKLLQHIEKLTEKQVS